MEAAYPQVKSYYKECCSCWHLRMMKRVFCHSTHLSESNMRPIYASQLLFHLLPFISITSGVLFLLTSRNSQRPLSEKLLFFPNCKEQHRAHLHLQGLLKAPSTVRFKGYFSATLLLLVLWAIMLFFSTLWGPNPVPGHYRKMFRNHQEWQPLRNSP